MLSTGVAAKPFISVGNFVIWRIFSFSNFLNENTSYILRGKVTFVGKQQFGPFTHSEACRYQR
jgi:hypothetical protein